MQGNANASSVGKFGGAFGFDGTGDYVQLISPNNIPIGDSPESFFVWVKSTTANDGAVFSQGTGSNGELRSILKLENSGFYFGGFGGEHECDHRSDMAADLLDGNWHQIGFVYRGEGNLSLYADSIEYTCSIFSALSTSSADAYLGSSALGWENPLNGQLDDAILFNRSLSAQEIKSLYNATVNRYSGDNSLVSWWKLDDDFSDSLGVHNAIANNVTFSSGKFGSAGVFNGIDSYTTSSGFTDLGTSNKPYSFSVWINAAEGEKDGNIIHMSSLVDGSGWCLPPVSLSGGVIGGLSYINGGPVVVYDSENISANQWYHVVNTWDSTNGLRLYVNGVLKGSTPQESYAASNIDNYLWLGYSTGACLGDKGNFSGSIDDAMVFNKSLSQEEVSDLYNQDWKYYNTFTNLSVGSHTFQAYAVDSTGTKYSTEERTINVSEAPLEELTCNPEDLPFLNEGEGYYEISDCCKLQAINNFGLGYNYVLTQDIDCSNSSLWNSGNGFLPIGNTTLSFTGNLNGNNYSVSNLYINRPLTNNIGLFGSLTGNVSNLGLTDLNVNGNQKVGGLAGWASGSRITNVYSTGIINGSVQIGGISGGITGQSVINNSNSSAVVYSYGTSLLCRMAFKGKFSERY